MSGAVRLHTQLLNQAKLLATKEPRRPKKASLRRSISASYYSVYHFLVFKATRKLVGTRHALQPLRELSSRAFDHGEMKEACESFQHGGRGNLPDEVEKAMQAVSIPSELAEIASHFVDLQQQRHQADYNLRLSFRKRDALDAHSKAEAVLKNLWSPISNADSTKFFLMSLLTWNRIRTRKSNLRWRDAVALRPGERHPGN